MGVFRKMAAAIIATVLMASCSASPESAGGDDPSKSPNAKNARVVPGSPAVLQSNLPAGSNGVMSDFLAAILKGVGSEIGEELAGWGIGALFGTGGDKQQLSAIQDQLNQIQGQLTQIQADIEALEEEQAFDACAGQTTSASVGIATIEEQLQKYQNLLKSNETDPNALAAWANGVAGGGANARSGESVQWAVNQIEAVLTGMAATGSIGACAKALQANWTVPLAESDYYVTVYQYLGYFYNWEVIALNLLVEANHFLAAQAASGGGPLPPAPDIQKVCIDANAAQPKTYCNQALQMANLVYDNIWYQATKAGAAYAWSTDPVGWALAVQKGTSLLWVKDLNTYGDLSGCTTPLQSTGAACGPTAGTDGPLSVTTHAGYSGWTVARFAQWRDLLNTPKNGGAKLATVMENVGFPTANNQANLIIYTGEYIASSKSYPEMSWPSLASRSDPYGPATDPPMQPLTGGPSGMCMMDTQMITHSGGQPWPYCRGGEWFWNLANVTEILSKTEYQFDPSDFTQSSSSNPGFYKAALHGKYNRGGIEFAYGPATPVTKPGWMSVGSNGATPQYRWPVLDVGGTTVTCSQIKIGDSQIMLTEQGAGSAYMMCGADFQSWLKTWLPDPPPTYSPSPFHP